MRGTSLAFLRVEKRASRRNRKRIIRLQSLAIKSCQYRVSGAKLSVRQRDGESRSSRLAKRKSRTCSSVFFLVCQHFALLHFPYLSLFPLFFSPFLPIPSVPSSFFIHLLNFPLSHTSFPSSSLPPSVARSIL